MSENAYGTQLDRDTANHRPLTSLTFPAPALIEAEV
jgi:hypothetical protein